MQDEYTGGFARGSPMAALAQNYVVLDIGAFTLLLASCFRFTPVSLFYFVAFFATQSMTPKDVSSWFVLLGMLAVVSFAACAFHTAWVISLLVGFALPKEALFIFQTGVEDAGGWDIAGKAALPDVIISVCSLLGFVALRNKMNANTLRSSIAGDFEEGEALGGQPASCCSASFRRSFWIAVCIVSSVAACVSNISIVTCITYVCIQGSLMLYVLRAVSNVRKFVLPTLVFMRAYIAAVCIVWYTVHTAKPSGVTIDAMVGFQDLGADILPTTASIFWAWVSLLSFVVFYTATCRVLADLRNIKGGGVGSFQESGGASTLSSSSIENASRPLLAEADGAGGADQAESREGTRVKKIRSSSVAQRLLGSNYEFLISTEGWLKRTLRFFQFSRRNFLQCYLSVMFLLCCSLPTATSLYAPVLLWVIVSFCSATKESIFRMLTNIVVLKVIHVYAIGLSALIFFFGIQGIKELTFGEHVPKHLGIVWNGHAWTVVLAQAVLTAIGGAALRQLEGTVTPPEQRPSAEEGDQTRPKWQLVQVFGVRIWDIALSAWTIMLLLWKLLWTYTFVPVLLLLYISGMLNINVVNVGYLLFFVVFSVWKNWRESYWFVLVVYGGLVVSIKFIYKVTAGTETKIVGLSPGPVSESSFSLLLDNSQLDFLLGVIIFFASAIHMQVNTAEDYERNQEKIKSLRKQLSPTTDYIFVELPLQVIERASLVVVIVIILLSSLQPPTVMTLFSLVDVIGILFITALNVDNISRRYIWTRRWVSVWILIEGLCLVILYLYQFDAVAQFFYDARGLPQKCNWTISDQSVWQCTRINSTWVTFSDLGLREFESSGASRLAVAFGMFYNCVSFVALLILFISVGRKLEKHRLVSGDSFGSEADYYQLLDDEVAPMRDVAVAVGSNVRSQCAEVTHTIVVALKYFCYTHGGKMGIIAAVIICGSDVCAFQFILLLLLCALVICTGKQTVAGGGTPIFSKAWSVIFVCGAIRSVLTILFQFNSVYYHVAVPYSDDTTWAGLRVAWVSRGMKVPKLSNPERATMMQMWAAMQESIYLILIGFLMKMSLEFRPAAREFSVLWKSFRAQENISAGGEERENDGETKGEELHGSDEPTFHRRSGAFCFHFGSAVSAYTNTYAAHDASFILSVVSAFSHVDMFSILYMGAALMVSRTPSRILSKRTFIIFSFVSMLSVIVKYAASLNVPSNFRDSGKWKNYLDELDASVGRPGLSRWLGVYPETESQFSCTVDATILMASILYIRHSSPPFSKFTTETVSGILEPSGGWEEIRALVLKNSHILITLLIAMGGLMLSAGNYGLMGISYVLIASYLMARKDRIDLKVAQNIQTFNLAVLFMIVCFQIPVFMLPDAAKGVVTKHSPTLNISIGCKADVGCMTIVLLGLRKLKPTIDSKIDIAGACGCFKNASTAEPVCSLNCESAFEAPLYIYGHLVVCIGVMLTIHILSHPAYLKFMPIYFETIAAKSKSRMKAAEENEKYKIARLWYLSLKKYSEMKQKLSLVISEIQVWQHEVRNGGVHQPSARDLLPPPEKLKVVAIEENGSVELSWKGAERNHPVYYRIALQRLPTQSFMGEFQDIMTVVDCNTAVLGDLDANGNYEAKICAYDGWGESMYSEPVRFTALCEPGSDSEKVESKAEGSEGSADAAKRDWGLHVFTTGTVLETLTRQSERICIILLLAIPLCVPDFFSGLYPLSFFVFCMVERKRQRYLYWTYVLFYAVLLLNVRVWYSMTVSIISKVEDPGDGPDNDQTGGSKCEELASAKFFSQPSVTTRDGVPGITLCVFDALLVIVIMVHRNVSQENGFWPVGSESLGNDWAVEVVEQASGPTNRELDGPERKSYCIMERFFPSCVITYFDRVAPLLEPPTWPEFSVMQTKASGKEELNNIQEELHEELQEELDNILAHVGPAVGPSILKKPGFNYYSYSFFAQLSFIIWHLFINQMNNGGLFKQNSKSYFVSVLGIFVIIFADRIAYSLAALRLKLYVHYAFCAGSSYAYFYYTTRECKTAVDTELNSVGANWWQVNISTLLMYACLYFSSMQVRHGYELLGRDRAPMTSRHGYGPLSSVSFKTFQVIPFLSTTRSLMDYMTTDTSLDAFMWLKLDSIHGVFFNTKCEMNYRERFGEVLSGREKYPFGWKFLYAGLVAIVMFLIFVLPPALGLSDASKRDAFAQQWRGQVTTIDGSVHLRFENSGGIIYHELELFSATKYRNKVTQPEEGQDQFVDQLCTIGPVPDRYFNPPSELVSEALEQLADPVYNGTLFVSFQVSTKWNLTDDRKEFDGPYNFSEPLGTAATATMRDVLNAYLNPSEHGIAKTVGPFLYAGTISGELHSEKEVSSVSFEQYGGEPSLKFALNFTIDKRGNSLWKLYTVEDTGGAFILNTRIKTTVSTVVDQFKKVLDNFVATPGGNQFYIVFLFLFLYKWVDAGITMLYKTGIESIPYNEMKYPDLLLEICQALFILRNETYKGHLRDEIQLYYFLLDILKSSNTLQQVTWADPKLRFSALAEDIGRKKKIQ
jgi:hypothetical protein